MGVDASEKGGVVDVLHLSTPQDQRYKNVKEKGRKGGSSGSLVRTSSSGSQVEDERDVQKEVRSCGSSKDGMPKFQSVALEELKKKQGGGNMRMNTQGGSVLTGMPGAFSFNATHVIRGPDDGDSNYEAASVASLEFKSRVERGMHRTVLGPLSKPVPSKWDDAEKWLIGLSSTENNPVRQKAKSGPLQSHLVVAAPNMAFQKRVMTGFGNHGGRQAAGNGAPAGKLAPLSNGSNSVTSGSSDAQSSGDDLTTTGEESGRSTDLPPRPSFERTKKVDTKYTTVQADIGAKFTFMPHTALVVRENTVDRYALDEVSGGNHASKPQETSDSNDDKFSKPALRTAKPTSDSVSEGDAQAENPAYDSAATVTVRSVSVRDMGTEMTPIASQTGTPLQATTPALGSPNVSRPATPSPRRGPPTCNTSTQCLALASQPILETEAKVPDASEKQLQVKTRQEILALGAQLGKANVAAWATNDSEDVARSLTVFDLEEVKRNILETRAAVWEEAEKSKYLARYTREESRIQAWENLEKAKAEAELRKIEVKLERVRAQASESLVQKLAAARRQAEDMRAAAEARRAEEAAKTAARAERFRSTGKMPGSFLSGLCCR